MFVFVFSCARTTPSDSVPIATRTPSTAVLIDAPFLDGTTIVVFSFLFVASWSRLTSRSCPASAGPSS